MKLDWGKALNTFIGGVLAGFGFMVLAMLLAACNGGDTVDPTQWRDQVVVQTSTSSQTEPAPCSDCDRYGDLKDVCLMRCSPDAGL